jgi:catechol 2,3-dioxygenase-like lactoylglutathione lyase family enzyme
VITLADIALVVPDQDQARRFYVDVLGFSVLEDHEIDGKRWVRLKAGRAGLVLRRASDDAQRARIGDQTGGSVFLFLETDDFDDALARLRAAAVVVVNGPRDEPYGRVIVFRDPFGNKLDLIEPSAARPR